MMTMNFAVMFLMAQMKIREFLADEKGEVNIVAMVVLIGIALLLAIVFKDAIGGLLKDLLKTIGDNGKNLVSQTIGD